MASDCRMYELRDIRSCAFRRRKFYCSLSMICILCGRYEALVVMESRTGSNVTMRACHVEMELRAHSKCTCLRMASKHPTNIVRAGEAGGMYPNTLSNVRTIPPRTIVLTQFIERMFPTRTQAIRRKLACQQHQQIDLAQ